MISNIKLGYVFLNRLGAPYIDGHKPKLCLVLNKLRLPSFLIIDTGCNLRLRLTSWFGHRLVNCDMFLMTR